MDLSPQLLQERLQAMPSEQVKSLLLAWLQDDRLGLQQLFQWVETTQPELEWGDITPQLEFQPLTEAEMLDQSLQALFAYQATPQAIAHSQVAAWAASLGTEGELPCPQ